MEKVTEPNNHVNDNLLNPAKKDNENWTDKMNRHLVLFYQIHRHINVPRRYPEFEGVKLGSYIRALRTKGQRVPDGFVERYATCGIPRELSLQQGSQVRSKNQGLKTYPKFGYFRKVNFDQINSEKQETIVYVMNTIMWLMKFMYCHYMVHHGKQLSSTNGLTKYQGHNRHHFCQWLYKDAMQTKTNNHGEISNGWLGCLATEKHKETRMMFEVLVDGVLEMLSEHYRCKLEIQDILLLVKTSFHDTKKFTKHIDERGNLNPTSCFVGAVSFCLMQSIVVEEPGGVTIYPECTKPDSRTQYTKCDSGQCQHKSTRELLRPYESIFIPNDIYHQSIYPKNGAQFNLILFIQAPNDSGTKNDIATRSKRKTRTSNLVLHRFDKDDFFRHFQKQTKIVFGDNSESIKKHKLK